MKQSNRLPKIHGFPWGYGFLLISGRGPPCMISKNEKNGAWEERPGKFQEMSRLIVPAAPNYLFSSYAMFIKDSSLARDQNPFEFYFLYREFWS